MVGTGILRLKQEMIFQISTFRIGRITKLGWEVIIDRLQRHHGVKYG